MNDTTRKPRKPRMTGIARDMLGMLGDDRDSMIVSTLLMRHARILEARGLVALQRTSNPRYPAITEYVMTLTDLGRESTT